MFKKTSVTVKSAENPCPANESFKRTNLIPLIESTAERKNKNRGDRGNQPGFLL